MSTLVVYSDTSDGHILSQDSVSWQYAYQGPADYSAVRAGTALGAYVGDAQVIVGQRKSSQSYQDENEDWWYEESFQAWEAFLAFDTSSVGWGTVSAAVLNLTSQEDKSVTDFIIEARLRDWGTGLTTADWVAGASLSGLTLLAHRDTASGWTVNTGYDLTDDAFAANVNKTGTTRLNLSSSLTRTGTEPSEYFYEQVSAYAADQAGTTKDPKLTITYTEKVEVYDGPGPTLDAVIRKTASASFTANAIFAVLRTGSFTANAVIKAAVPGSVTGDAIRLRTFHFGQGVW